MNFDISHLLDQWDYVPGQVVVRKFIGKDGREKIQLRVDLGLLQMNASGRPDGKRPYGHISLFDYYEAKLKKCRAEHEGNDDAFTLKAEDCSRLQMEALQYHHRYICLLQLEDFATALRDTTRNLKLFDFVALYAESDELSWSLQQFRPQLLMIHTRAKASQHLETGNFTAALSQVDAGIEAIREFYQSHARLDLLELSHEIHALEHLREEIQRKRPLSRREQLELDLHEALKREDYEEAARVRDALRALESSE
jgi:UvrB/UvrC motif-containing protein